MTDSLIILTLEDWFDESPTVLEADIYHEARGNTTWTDEDDDDLKNQALLRAWDYLCGLDWINGVFDDELPNKIKYAQIMAALEELQNPGCLNPVLSSEDYIESKNLAGAIIKTYRPNAPVKKRFLAVESLLKSYVRNMGAAVELVRG